MATLRIINSKSECVAEALTPQSFMDFKKRCAEEGLSRVALVVTLACGACYTARLLKKPTSVPEGLEAKGHDVWVEA